MTIVCGRNCNSVGFLIPPRVPEMVKREPDGGDGLKAMRLEFLRVLARFS